MSDHANDCPECGHENCEHTSATVLLNGSEMKAMIEDQRGRITGLEMTVEGLSRKEVAWKTTVERLNQENARLRNDNVAANVMLHSQRGRIQELESRGTLTEPCHSALHDQVEKVRAYVKGLRIWGTEDKAQICTDILYIIGEN